jgi:exosortase A-associated hydrolase 1
MYGILSLPERAASRGVLIVVGGPQYRVGSHRQFTLLARHLASLGIPVLRFDCRGMGDSEGAPRTFEDLEDDLHCAIERFFEEVPALGDLVIWGLCDAASAALFHAHRDRRITGLVLLNPWVRTDQGAAKAYLKHYYLTRLLDPELWSKMRNGRFNYANAARSLVKTFEKALLGRKIAAGGDTIGDGACDFTSLPERMLNALSRYKGKILLITSGNDLTAQEFLELVKGSREWQQLLAPPRVTHRNLPEANHTFSRHEWRDQVAHWTKEWLYTW